MSSPFPNSADSFLITRQVNLVQLEAEITKALGDAEHFFALTGPVEPTPDDPAQLWMSPPTSADGKAAVQSAIDSHLPDGNWGIPATVVAYQQLEASLQANPDTELTEADRHVLLVGLVLKSRNPVS